MKRIQCSNLSGLHYSPLNEKYMLRGLHDLSPSVVDAGSILKVVSITQENWSTEEVVLEELQVFQVLRSTQLHTQIHKHRNTSAHTLTPCKRCVLIDDANCSPAVLGGTVDSSNSEIFILPLLYKLLRAINQHTHLLFLFKQCSINECLLRC